MLKTLAYRANPDRCVEAFRRSENLACTILPKKSRTDQVRNLIQTAQQDAQKLITLYGGNAMAMEEAITTLAHTGRESAPRPQRPAFGKSAPMDLDQFCAAFSRHACAYPAPPEGGPPLREKEGPPQETHAPSFLHV